MKKVSFISFMVLVMVFNFSACKSESKKESPKIEVKKSTAAFAVAKANNDINFIAYKTTEKVGVNGWFKKINVISGGEGNSVKEAIHNSPTTDFEINGEYFIKRTHRKGGTTTKKRKLG